MFLHELEECLCLHISIGIDVVVRDSGAFAKVDRIAGSAQTDVGQA